MPQREPARRQTSGEPPSSKVKMRLDENGRFVPVLPDDAEPKPAGKDAERPPVPDEPSERHR